MVTKTDMMEAVTLGIGGREWVAVEDHPKTALQNARAVRYAGAIQPHEGWCGAGRPRATRFHKALSAFKARKG